MNVQGVIRQLKTEKAGLQNQINRLDSALSVLDGLNGSGRSRRGGRRNLSAAARNRIAAAQRARWAKWKAAHKKK